MSKKIRKLEPHIYIPLDCWCVVLDYVNTPNDLISLFQAHKNLYNYYDKYGQILATHLVFPCDLTKLKQSTVLTKNANKIEITKMWPSLIEKMAGVSSFSICTTKDPRTSHFLWSLYTYTDSHGFYGNNCKKGHQDCSKCFEWYRDDLEKCMKRRKVDYICPFQHFDDEIKIKIKCNCGKCEFRILKSFPGCLSVHVDGRGQAFCCCCY